MLKIYTLSSSRNPEEIRYVGKTIRSLKARLNQHLCDAKRHKLREIYSVYNYNWINYEIENGYSIIIEELDTLDLNLFPDWKWLEQYWIAQLKNWGFKLTNLTSGGDGNQNQVFTKEALLKRSKALKGKARPQEVRDKISKSHKGKKLTQDHKENVRNTIRKLQGKSIKQYDIECNFIKTWACVKDAADYYNVDAGNIIKCCKKHKKHQTCKGYIWRYSDDDSDINISINVVNQYDLKGNLIKTWPSALKAAEELNLSYSSIYRCCKNKKESYNSYIWKFEIMNIQSSLHGNMQV